MGQCGNCGSNGLPNGCKNNGNCGSSGCNKLTVFDWLADLQEPSGQEKCSLAEIQFKNDRKEYFDNTENLPLQIGDAVTVEASPGHDVGRVTMLGELVKTQIKVKKIKEEKFPKIYRKSNVQDLEAWIKSREKEEEIKIKARKIAREQKLTMKICDVEFQGDGSKLTFYYTAEGRVDFRNLIKEYATQFRARIDMRQIGYRQESAKIGGIGSCGRELCCATWLTDFRSVNTNVARYQQLSINPQKLAGQCGKLKCCLNYELDSYLDALNDFPPNNTQLITEKGRAKSIKIDIFRKRMWFVYDKGDFQWYDFSVDQVKEFLALNKKGEKLPPLEDLMVEKNTLETVDIIEENSLERFDFQKKKRRNNKSKNKEFTHPKSKNKKTYNKQKPSK